MSAATEFAPVVFIPERARNWDRRPLADVIELHRPPADTIAAPLRLTRRGVVALGALAGLVCAVLVWIAWLSAPSAGSAGSAGTGGRAATVPAAVTVQAGDTLWSIAGRVAPQRDPRAEVALLQRVNHLDGVGLAAGQVLRTS
jgi:hypothetical protein